MKSLTTDEIHLNDALAAEGIRALETDFAELILQLDGDWSSHILVPAIHRNRREIRDLFARTIAPGLESDEPAVLAEASRRYLRERFLNARMGVSGANFGVADTGTLVVVESEGNGRMCTTLPPVLVSILGIEKLVPTFQDLEVFLQLLPRSSTGERMNPYTSLWTGATEGQELHVVLLDNGRTNASEGPGGSAGAPVHPLQRLPQRLPCLHPHGWACIRLRLPGPDRRHPHAAARRHRERAHAAVRVVALRRLRRRLPREDRDPQAAAPPARPGAEARRRAGGLRRRRRRVRRTRAATGSARSSPGSSAGRCCASGRCAPGRTTRDLRPAAPQSFRDWWAGGETDDDAARRSSPASATRAATRLAPAPAPPRLPSHRPPRLPPSAPRSSANAPASTAPASSAPPTSPPSSPRPAHSRLVVPDGAARGLAARRASNAIADAELTPHELDAARRRHHGLHARDCRDRHDRPHRRADRRTPCTDARTRPARLRRP